MVPAAHPTSDRRAPGDGRRVPEGRRDRLPPAGQVGARAGKTGQRADHRLRTGKRHRSGHSRPTLRKTGQRGDHRLWRGVGESRRPAG